MAVGLLPLLVGAGPLTAQAGLGTDSLSAVRVPAGAAVRLDGVPSESFWAEAPVMSDFRQREPLEGVAATERTEVRVAYDDDALYVAVRAFDSRPGEIVARVRQRDRILSGSGFGLEFQGDDVIALVFDPFLDRRNGILFATNPNGAQFDALLTDEGDEINVDWQAVWDVSAARGPDGWTAEFAIPWATLRYPRDSSAGWGFNVTRVIQRMNEEVVWRSWEREGGGFERLSRAGRLTGLVDLPRPRASIELKPYGLGGVRWTRDDGGLDRSSEVDVGVDLKSEIRPGLVLDLTVNTDFAQVEVDDQQVNLTRFNLFFPEKRDFFLENAGVFEFGQTGYFGPPPFLMFFSRRIGIGDEGPVPVLGGGRLTGRVGAQTLGLLSVVTDEAGGRDREMFNVARVKRDVGRSSYVGAMLTDRRGDEPGNTVVGVDGRFNVSPTLVAEGFAARTFTEGAGGEGTSVFGSLNYTADLWGGFLQLLQVGEGTRAGSGFVARTDYRNARMSLRRSIRPGVLGLRKVDFRASGGYESRIDGTFQGREVSLSVGPQWDTGDQFTLSYERAAEQVDEAFTLADSLPVPTGRFDRPWWSFRGSTSDRRPWSLAASASGGDFFGGDLLRWGGTLTVAPAPAVAVAVGFDRNDVDLPSGSFTADVTSLRLTWALSTRITTNALIQHNSLTDEILTNVRFNFIHRPGSDLFIVFTEDRLGDGSGWPVEDRGLVAKLTWLLRF